MTDGDMKIFGKSADINSAVELTEDFETMNRHRANGNIEKAKRLGRRLATIDPMDGNDGLIVNLRDVLPQKFLSQDIIYQIKVLLVFAAESVAELEIKYPQLAATAINELYDSLSVDSPGFFRNIADGAAFTFYYLAMKKGGDVAKNIGETFAMLCSVQKNRDGFISAGETVWKLAVETVKSEIAAARFEQIE